MSGQTLRERRHWMRVRRALSPAVDALFWGDAETPAEAVRETGVHLSPGERADAVWLVERAAEAAEERTREAVESWNRAVEQAQAD